MNLCDEYLVKTLRYLDNELVGRELEDFRSHLESCADCRTHLEAEETLSEMLLRSRPLYSAPAALRARVSSAVIQQSSPSYRRLTDVFGRLSVWRALVPAALAIGICLAVIPDISRGIQATLYVETAVAAHREFLGRTLPVGVQSTSPQAVTAWFAGKLPFDFRLPAAESIPGEKSSYQLIGATLVHYKGQSVALVMYDAPHDKISLLVASSQSAPVTGGDEIGFGRLTFHFRTDSGFRVITWSNHGLSYALVSSVSAPPRASCLVCHQNMPDGGNFDAQRWPLLQPPPRSARLHDASNPL